MSTRIGCSGWSYDDWVGPFYPANTKPDEYLKLYSRIFDTVELDSTFYRVPSAQMVNQWYTNTPDQFLFCPKVPKRITHDLHLENSTQYYDHFSKRMSALKEKLGPILLQMPPSFKYQKHREQLAHFLNSLDHHNRYAIEFRNESWFNSEVQKLLSESRVCQVWSINQYLTTPPTLTADFVYMRFVGDRTIDRFDKIQKDQSQVMETWSKSISQAPDSREKFVLFNNHFAGFGPGSANEFRRLMGLAQLDWSNLKKDSAQKSMLDF